MKSYLENLSKIFAVCGTLFILFGLLVANFYYSAFNIDIFSFIEFSEAIMLFLNDIIPLIVIISIITVLMGIYMSEGGKIDERKPIHIFLFFIPFLFIGLDFLIKYYIKDHKFLNITWYSYWLPFIKIIYIFVNARLFMSRKYNSFILFHTIGIFIVGLICTSQIKIIKTLKNNNQQIEIILKDHSIIKSDSTNLFLGKTKNYFIFFNTLTRESSFQPTGSVEKVSIKNL
ncbi:MAG: hypothetical protein ABIN97_06740 [Ginsengibacter sp.]